MKVTLFTIAVMLIAWTASGQTLFRSVHASAGGTGESGGLSMCWTLGEAVAGTLNNGVTVSQGFHQTAFVVTEIQPPEDFEFVISVFPNPATEFLTINMKPEGSSLIYATMYDLSGKEIMSAEMTESDYTFDLRNLSNGCYLLRIEDRARFAAKSYKIQKINQ